MTSAMRSLVHPTRDGVRLLRSGPDIPYRDGAEDRVWEIAKAATDLGSESTELLEAAHGWAEEYHTHPARANVVRALQISAGAAVLEIGSGCGPITRYLGETGAEVDAVEPVLSRARVGRERTRDLPNVEVFCGDLEDVPGDPVYDLVVVVGVLEYAGGGTAEREPYLNFLRECRQRLRPGGSLVLAIENKLGVKYLTGTAEDHSGRLFDSVEDYPRGTPARTFGSTALLGLMHEVGFSTAHLYGAFPDYKHTRVVFDTDRLLATAPDLLENLPSFPSRYAGTRSVRLASEERVWKELVREGEAVHFANSFLVVADTDGPSGLWPADQLATYFSINRRAEYAAVTRVRRIDGTVCFDRSYNPVPGRLIVDGVTWWDYVPGSSFLEVFFAAEENDRRALLGRWGELVRRVAAQGSTPLDAIPSNVIVTGDGSLELIDSEFHDDVSVDRVIERGLFWLAVHLVRSTPPEAWSPARTIGDVFDQLARLAGADIDEAALAQLLDHEAAFQITVSTQFLGPDAQALGADRLRAIYDSDIWDVPLGRRLHHLYDNEVKAGEGLRTHYQAAIEQRDKLRSHYQAAIAQRDRLRERYHQEAEARAELKKRVTAQEKQIKRLGREAEKSSAAAERARRALADVKASRTYRFADSLRRGIRKVKPR